MTNDSEWRIENGLEGIGRSLFELFRHITGRTDENHEKSCRDSRCAGRDSNQEPLPAPPPPNTSLGRNRYAGMFGEGKITNSP